MEGKKKRWRDVRVTESSLVHAARVTRALVLQSLGERISGWASIQQATPVYACSLLAVPF